VFRPPTADQPRPPSSATSCRPIDPLDKRSATVAQVTGAVKPSARRRLRHDRPGFHERRSLTLPCTVPFASWKPLEQLTLIAVADPADADSLVQLVVENRVIRARLVAVSVDTSWACALAERFLALAFSWASPVPGSAVGSDGHVGMLPLLVGGILATSALSSTVGWPPADADLFRPAWFISSWLTPTLGVYNAVSEGLSPRTGREGSWVAVSKRVSVSTLALRAWRSALHALLSSSLNPSGRILAPGRGFGWPGRRPAGGSGPRMNAALRPGGRTAARRCNSSQ